MIALHDGIGEELFAGLFYMGSGLFFVLCFDLDRDVPAYTYIFYTFEVEFLKAGGYRFAFDCAGERTSNF